MSGAYICDQVEMVVYCEGKGGVGAYGTQCKALTSCLIICNDQSCED